MVAKIRFIKYLKDALSYNEKKVREGKAELLFAAGFPRDIDRLTYRSKMALFKKLTSQNQRAAVKIVHLTLNFHPKDKLDKELLIKIANDYTEGIGLGGQPYLVYQHFDAAHPHIHIMSVNIVNGGKRIELYDKGFIKSDAVNNEIERIYGLEKIQDHMGKETPQMAPETRQLERVRYGTVETGTAIISIVSEVLKSYKFCSLADFNEILHQFGVLAYNGVPGGKMRSSGGIVYWLLRENDQKVGVAIRPRFIQGTPTLRNLEKRYRQHKISRRPQGQRLRNLLDKALTTTQTQEEMQQFLGNHGIRAVFREDNTPKIIGVTYIDNATRTAYNGLDLGRPYHALTFYRALQEKPSLRQNGLALPEAKEEPMPLPYPQNELPSPDNTPGPGTKFIPAQDLPVIQVLPDKYFFEYEQQQEQERQQALEKSKSKEKGRELEL